jgi:hypothetical protein
VARLHELRDEFHLRRHLLEQAPVWELPQQGEQTLRS